MSNVADRLVQTKLYPPRVPEQLVNRQHLLARLNRGRKRPLILFSAPAGYGKTTLAHQWLEAGAAPYAWLSLDEFDQDLETVLAYIVAALEPVVPGMGQETSLLLKQPQLPRPERLADSLVRDLQALSQPVYLAIDDYHTVVDQDFHTFMARLLQRMPQDLRIVLLTRVDPPLALARMRGRREMLEIRAADLRFTTTEATQLLQQIIGRPLATDTADLLATRTEGWAVGLRMAALSLRDSEDAQSFVARYLEGGQKLIYDYLLSEVLAQLPADQRALLLRTAIVDQFGPALVDALVDQPDSPLSGQDFVDNLWSSNFFLIALDDQGHWYRYHHIFRLLLQQQLAREYSSSQIAELHLIVADWFAAADMIESAVIHYLHGGDAQKAAKIVESQVHHLMNREEWRLLDRWLHLLHEECRARPGLLATQAAIAQIQMRVSTIQPILDAAKEGLHDGSYDYSLEEARSWEGVIDIYRGICFDPAITPQDTLAQTEQGLQKIAAEARYIRGVAEIWQIIALHQSGHTAQAIDEARRKLGQHVGPWDTRTHRLMLAIGAVYYSVADCLSMRNLARAYRVMARQTEHYLSLGWANFILGWSYYQRDELQKAEACFNWVADNRFLAHIRCVLDSMSGLALCQFAQGRSAEVLETLGTLREFLVEQDQVSLVFLVDSLQAHLNQTWDSFAGDSAWMPDPAAQLSNDAWELPVITGCYTAIASGDSERLTQAEQTLAECRRFARSRNEKRQLMRIEALQALLHAARGATQQALNALRTAVTLGEQGGALRIFVDIGPGLLPLLRELRDQGTAVAYIGRILAAYSRREGTPAADEVTARDEDTAAPALTPEAAALLSELTNREMEVLLLLARRLTNKEIAAELYISPHTVKKYTLALYQKLGVNGRRQAVTRALELGII